MQQHYVIQSLIARDHVDVLRREARQARMAARSRRHGTRSNRRSR